MADPLVHEIALRCSAAHAFLVFTEKVDLWWPKAHRKFAGSTLRQEPFVGGQLVERAPNGDEFVLADVLDCTPSQVMRLAWHPGKITAPTETLITFTPTGPHDVVVRVEHREGDAALGARWDSRAAMFDTGWSTVLAAMAKFIKEGN